MGLEGWPADVQERTCLADAMPGMPGSRASRHVWPMTAHTMPCYMSARGMPPHAHVVQRCCPCRRPSGLPGLSACAQALARTR